MRAKERRERVPCIACSVSSPLASYYVVLLSSFNLLSSFAIGIIVDPSVFSSGFALCFPFELMLTHSH
jgi:hypothetical protein